MPLPARAHAVAAAVVAAAACGRSPPRSAGAKPDAGPAWDAAPSRDAGRPADAARSTDTRAPGLDAGPGGPCAGRPAGTPCAPASCADGLLSPAATCDGAGLCVRPAPAPCPADAPYCEAGSCLPCRRPDRVVIDPAPSVRAFGVALDAAARVHALYAKPAGDGASSVHYAVCTDDCLVPAGWSVLPVPGVAADDGERASWAVDDAGAVRVTGANGAYAECDGDCGRIDSWASSTLDFLGDATAAVAHAAGRTHLFWAGDLFSDWDVLHASCEADCTDVARWSAPGRVDGWHDTCAGAVADAGADPDGGLYVLYVVEDCDGGFYSRLDRCPEGRACDGIEWPETAWVVDDTVRLSAREQVAVAPGPDGAMRWLWEASGPDRDCGGTRSRARQDVRLRGPGGERTLAHERVDLTAPVVEEDGRVAFAARLGTDLLLAAGAEEGEDPWTWHRLDGLVERPGFLPALPGRRLATDERGLHLLVGGRYVRIPHAPTCGCAVALGGARERVRGIPSYSPEIVAVAPDGTAHAFQRHYHWNEDMGLAVRTPPWESWDGVPVAVAFEDGGGVHLLVEEPDEERYRYVRCGWRCEPALATDVPLGVGSPGAIAVVQDAVYATGGDRLYACPADCDAATSWSSAPAPFPPSAAIGRAGDELAIAQVAAGVLQFGRCDSDCLDPDRWRLTTVTDAWSGDVPSIAAYGDAVYLLARSRLAACPGACDEPGSWTSFTISGASPPLLVSADGVLMAGGAAFATCESDCHLLGSWRTGVLPTPVTALAPGVSGWWRALDFDWVECRSDEGLDVWRTSARVTCLP